MATLLDHSAWVGCVVCFRSALLDLHVRVLECGVGQAEAELVLGSDILLLKGEVVDVDPFGEVALREVRKRRLWLRGMEEVSVVALLASHCVWELAAEVLVAVEEGDESTTGVLAGKMSVDDRRDVGMIDKLINDTDTCVVHDNHGVGALTGDIIDQCV